MKRFNQVLLFFILSIFNTFLFAQHKVIQIQNDVTRLDFKTEGRYTQIDYSGAYPVIKQPNPGHPELPIISYRLIVREGASVSSVEIIGITETELPGNYYLYPAQQQFAIGEERVFTPPDPQIYQQNEKYPATLVRHVHTGNFGGRRIASFLVYPLRYNPVTQKLYFYEEITFRIRYSTGAVETIRPERLFKQDQARFEGVVRRMVANPEEVTQYRPVIEQTRVSGNLEFSQVPSAEGLGVRYLVITSDALAPAFEPLVEFKNTTGTTAEIRSLEWIKANTHPGVDDAETIRNFIKWAYQKWGTQYVLLGGDTGIIPTRMVYSNTMTVSTDMYFSDLDGSWNYDGDSRFGEVEDSLDYYPEMFVSRAPVHSAAEASNFVNKTLTYLKAENFPSGYTTGMLTIGADLWSQGDGGEFCEFVTDSVPAYINKTTLYEGGSPGSSPQQILQHLNDGYNFIFSTTHGAYNTLKTEADGYLYTHDIATLQNSEYSIWFASTCGANKIEANSLSERFMNLSGSGGVGFIGSTSLDYPFGMRYMNQRLITHVYDNTYSELSPANLLSKLDYIPWFSNYNGPARQLYLTYATLGDPQLKIWTGNLTGMTANLSDPIHLGQNDVTVTVTTTDAVPKKVAGATVCLYKDDDIWETAVTDANGEVQFSFQAHQIGTVYLTVSKTNNKPYLGSLEVEAVATAHLRIKSTEIAYDDNSNGKVESGETVDLSLEVENNGSVAAENIQINVTSADPQLTTIIEGQLYLEALSSGQSAWVEGTVRFAVENTIPVDTLARFPVSLQYAEEIEDSDQITLPLYAPEINVTENNIIFIPETYTCMLYLKLSNYGQGTSSSLTASLQTDNPNVLDIDPDSITFSALEPGQSAWGNAQFFINFEELPSSTLGTFILEINDIYNRTWPITLVLTTEQLPPPDSLEFQPESQTSLRLSWAPVTLGSGEEIRYDVYRRPEGSGSFQKINTLPVANSTRFFDENLTGNQNYEYRVRAVDPSGRISGYISTLVGWGTVPLQSGFPQYANDYRIGLEGDAVAFDFNGGDKEIIAPGNNGQLIIYHSDGSVYHQFSGLEGNLMTPAFGNVDNDQNIEMLVPCYKNGADGNKIYIFDCATLNREYTLIHPNRYSVNNVALADINGNGKMEIFATGFGGNNPDDSVKTKSKLFAWEYGVFGDGTSGFSLYASRVFEETPYLLNPPAIHDLDNTGAPEIALGVKNDLLVLNSQTLQTLSSYTCGEGVISCQTSFGDLDNDGEYDLVFTTDGDSTIDNTLWVLKYSDIPDSYNLQLNWSTNVPGIINLYGFSPSPTLGDVDNDARLEIALTAENYIYIYDDDGSSLNSWPVEWKSGINQSFSKAGTSHPLLGDINGDGNDDLLVASSRKLLYAFDIASGNWLKGFPVALGLNWKTTPFVVDLDGDSDMETIFQEHDGKLYVFDIPGTYQTPALEWPMRYGNLQHTGVYTPNSSMSANLITNTSVKNLPGIPNSFALKQNYPNPFNPTTTIRYDLPRATQVRIAIYNILGQKIKTLVDARQAAGRKSVIWNGENDLGVTVGSGIYIYRIKAGDFEKSLKMLFIK